MTYEMISKIMSSIKPGVFTRMTYMSELPLKAAYKKQGYTISKLTDTTVRFGINYANIKGVVLSENPRKSNVVALVKNKLYRNEESGQTYVRAYPIRLGSNSKTQYVVKLNGEYVSDFANEIPENIKEMVINSYWTGRKFTPVMQIKTENVLRIG